MREEYLIGWNTKDREWLKKRKEKYKKDIEPVLKKMVRQGKIIRKPDLKFLKRFYIFGEFLPYDETWVSSFGSCYFDPIGKPYVPHLIFKIWFHPVEDKALFERIIAEHFTLFDAFSDTEELRRYSFWNKYNQLWLDSWRFPKYFEGRSYYLDKLAVPKTWSFIANPPQSHAHLYQSDEPGFWEERKYQLLYKISNTFKHIYYGEFLVFAFSFDLFKDLLNVCDIDGGFEFQGRPYVVREVLIDLFEHFWHGKKRRAQLNKDLIKRFKKEFPEFMDNGINPEVDELWQRAKEKPLEK